MTRVTEYHPFNDLYPSESGLMQILGEKKALIPSFAGKALKVATDLRITICRGPDFHHRSILANFARKHRRLWVVDF